METTVNCDKCEGNTNGVSPNKTKIKYCNCHDEKSQSYGWLCPKCGKAHSLFSFEDHCEPAVHINLENYKSMIQEFSDNELIDEFESICCNSFEAMTNDRVVICREEIIKRLQEILTSECNNKRKEYSIST